MPKKIAPILGSLLVGALLVAAGCSSTNTNSNTNTRTNTSTTTVNTNVPLSNQNVDVSNTNGNNANVSSTAPAATVSITATGFSPETVTIKVGETVTWVNNDTTNHWPAVDPHPAHTNLPGFDSFGIDPGQSYSETFTKVGNWGYHDHLFSFLEGTVIVTQ